MIVPIIEPVARLANYSLDRAERASVRWACPSLATRTLNIRCLQGHPSFCRLYWFTTAQNSTTVVTFLDGPNDASSNDCFVACQRGLRLRRSGYRSLYCRRVAFVPSYSVRHLLYLSIYLSVTVVKYSSCNASAAIAQSAQHSHQINGMTQR